MVGKNKEIEIRCGVPQESVLGILWNIYYDGVLHLEMAEGALMLGFTNKIEIMLLVANRSVRDFGILVGG